jgi:hypothetical protein
MPLTPAYSRRPARADVFGRGRRPIWSSSGPGRPGRRQVGVEDPATPGGGSAERGVDRRDRVMAASTRPESVGLRILPTAPDGLGRCREGWHRVASGSALAPDAVRRRSSGVGGRHLQRHPSMLRNEGAVLTSPSPTLPGSCWPRGRRSPWVGAVEVAHRRRQQPGVRPLSSARSDEPGPWTWPASLGRMTECRAASPRATSRGWRWWRRLARRRTSGAVELRKREIIPAG